MAQAVAKLISENVRHACGAPVECVIADTCIGGVAEAARTAEKFARARRRRLVDRLPLLVLRLETMDMDPMTPQGCFGASTAPSGRGPSIWLPSWRGITKRACPRSASTGRDVQDQDQTEIPADVRQKVLGFVRAGLAAATLRGNPTSRWATSRWASPARWSTTISLSDTWA